MDRRKAYQILVVVLFFAFISLISRSILYFVLSIASAAIILFLLTSTKKKQQSQTGTNEEKKAYSPHSSSLTKFFLATTILGGTIFGYGTLFFQENSFFHKFISAPEELYSALLFIALGSLLTIVSLYYFIKEILFVKENKDFKGSYCTSCGKKIEKHSKFCSGCGKQLA